MKGTRRASTVTRSLVLKNKKWGAAHSRIGASGQAWWGAPPERFPGSLCRCRCPISLFDFIAGGNEEWQRAQLLQCFASTWLQKPGSIPQQVVPDSLFLFTQLFLLQERSGRLSENPYHCCYQGSTTRHSEGLVPVHEGSLGQNKNTLDWLFVLIKGRRDTAYLHRILLWSDRRGDDPTFSKVNRFPMK